MKRILILGGGIGGLVTANELGKKIGKEHQIVLFDKSDKLLFAPSIPWIMTGERKPEKIMRDYNGLQKKGIEFVNGEISEVNPDEKSLIVNGEKYTGDYMVIALGAELNDENLKDKGYNIYSVEDAQKLNKALNNFEGGKIVLLISSAPYKCPAAPYESAMLIEYYLRKKGFRDNAEISIYTPEPGPMGVAGKELSSAVRQITENKGIDYNPGNHFSSIDGKKLHFTNGESKEFDLLAYVPKHQCPQVIRQTDLSGENGWVKIKDRYTMETDFPGVFAIGDITHIPLALGKPLPKAGVFAHYQAEVVANNIAVDINGKGDKTKFNGDGECFFEIGGKKAGFARGNFYHEPLPDVKMYKPGFYRHVGKILFEKYFLSKWL